MVIYTCVWCGEAPVKTDPRGYCEQCAEHRRYIHK